MEEITFGKYALPVILMVILSLIYKVIAINKGWKPIIAVCLGILLGILGIVYNGYDWTAKIVIDHVLYGLMMGASAVGLYEIQAKVKRPRAP